MYASIRVTNSGCAMKVKIGVIRVKNGATSTALEILR